MSSLIHVGTASEVLAKLKQYLRIDNAEACQIAGLSRYEKKIFSHRWVAEDVIVTDEEKRVFDEVVQLVRVMEGTDGDSIRLKLGRTSVTSRKTYQQLLLDGFDGIREARKQLMSR